MSTFWSVWIIVLTIVSLILLLWVLLANKKVAVNYEEETENRTTGHSYDGIEEYDNPLPKWWFQLFILTIVFAVVWLILYPGLGKFPGVLGWTSVGELARSQEKAVEQYAQSYGVYSKMPVEDLIHDSRAIKMGVRLFADNCAVCHGADGGGNYGFPNLTDNEWLYGGTVENIQQSITHGRTGAMPAWGDILGEEKVQRAAHYVLQLSGQAHDAALADSGQQVYMETCSACHGANGEGNTLLGAPNLTDDVWLYSGTLSEVAHSIRSGRSNTMPAQKELLREDKIHLLAAYVYSLSYDYE